MRVYCFARQSRLLQGHTTCDSPCVVTPSRTAAPYSQPSACHDSPMGLCLLLWPSTCHRRACLLIPRLVPSRCLDHRSSSGEILTCRSTWKGTDEIRNSRWKCACSRRVLQRFFGGTRSHCRTSRTSFPVP